ncbi:MAG: HAD-IB family hydrolase [Nocardioides sp.]|nr:HAD-IB family hydrolase [Nocardioides sp.]
MTDMSICRDTTMSRLISTPSRSRILVVWDVDRTLTRSDTLVPFLWAVTGGSGWTAALPRIVRDLLQNREAAKGFRTELKDSLLRHALAERRCTDVEAVAQAFAEELLADRCRPDALARWEWHRDHGDALVLASASLAMYLRPFGALLGADYVLATELATSRGRLTGARSTANCRGAEKARRVADLITATRPDSVWVYTDSRSDRPSLALADVKTVVRPAHRLHAP